MQTLCMSSNFGKFLTAQKLRILPKMIELGLIDPTRLETWAEKNITEEDMQSNEGRYHSGSSIPRYVNRSFLVLPKVK